jgi:quercetin dioxygenase-like cupin family protein
MEDAMAVHIQNRELGERLGSSVLLAAFEDLMLSEYLLEPGTRPGDPHYHANHTDAFYVIEGELTFAVGRESETITVSPGGLVAVPPGVAHSFRSAGDHTARWLTIHAPDGGFAAFMRGVRDGVEVEWDIAAVPADGGAPAREAIVSRPPSPRR